MAERVTDLTFLNNFAKGDEAILEKFIRIFLTDGASIVDQLQERIMEIDWPGVERAAHTLRSQFNFMGIKEGEERLRTLKENASSQKDISAAKSDVNRISELFSGAAEELEDELNFLKNSKIHL